MDNGFGKKIVKYLNKFICNHFKFKATDDALNMDNKDS